MATARRTRGAGRQSAAGREVGAALLLAEDVRVVLLLLNAARYRALKRMFGTGRADANLVTLVAAAAVVDAAARGTARLTAPGAPAPADVALSVAAGGSALSAIAGTAIAGGGGALLGLAVVYKLLGVPAGRAASQIARSPFRLRSAVMEQARRLAADTARPRQARAEPTPAPPTTAVTG
jgi:hypothetical protein